MNTVTESNPKEMNRGKFEWKWQIGYLSKEGVSVCFGIELVNHLQTFRSMELPNLENNLRRSVQVPIRNSVP